MHARLLAAFKTKNAAVIKSLFTKDFTQSANGMTFNRDQAVAQMTQGTASPRVDWTISGIEVSGEKASYMSNLKYETNSSYQGKNHKLIGSGVQKVQMVKKGRKWLYSHLEVISSKMMMDGKPFNPMAQPAEPGKPVR